MKRKMRVPKTVNSQTQVADLQENIKNKIVFFKRTDPGNLKKEQQTNKKNNLLTSCGNYGIVKNTVCKQAFKSKSA
jgi:hypothetical protein